MAQDSDFSMNVRCLSVYLRRLLIIAAPILVPIPAHAAIGVVQSTGMQNNCASTSVTTPAIRTTTGNGIVMTVAYSSSAGFNSITDNAGNTWTQMGPVGGDSGNPGARIRQYYNLSIQGAAAHTFTFNTISPRCASIAVNEISGQSTNGADQQGQGADASTGISHASPATGRTTSTNELLISSYSDYLTSEGLAASGGFTSAYISHINPPVGTNAVVATSTTSISVTVSNAALTVSFTSPADGALVSRTTTVGMADAGAIGASTFVLFLDGIVIFSQTVTGATSSSNWDTTGTPSGTHTLSVSVTDAAGRRVSAFRNVTVVNGCF